MSPNFQKIKTHCQRFLKMANSRQSSSTSTLATTGHDRDQDLEKDNSITPIDLRNGDLERGNKEQQAPPAVLDWDGPDDPENPINWPKWKRQFHVVLPAVISFAATLGSSIYTPAFPTIMEKWNVSSTVALLPLTLYVLALGFGPILAAPLSETYGRHIVYLTSAPLGALFTMGTGFSQNIETLCILRFFSGLAFSPALAIGAGSIADVNKPEDRALPSALYILSPFLGPALGPVIGAFVTVRKGWRWTQWTLIFFAIFAFILTMFAQETHKNTILARRAKRRNLPPPLSPFPSRSAKIRFLITVTFIRPLNMLLTEPIVAFLSLYVAFNFSVLFAFFAAFPYVFKSVYGFTTEQAGLVFLAIGIGCVLAVPTVLACDYWLYQPKVRESKRNGGSGAVAPEYRLYPAMIGSIGLPIGLFWFAWTARSSVSWASPVVSAIPFAWGNLSIFIAAATYLIDAYQALNGASAVAANGLLRYTLGGVFPLFTLQMYRNLGIDWATSLLGFIAVGLMPVPWVLFKFGKQIRKRSAYDMSNL
ncbi:MFS multidrug transporter-like protein [Cadophora sp. MPI-SDFR-AT-0126]|nr:MFS multidrug transporter-like protein [Leotiomycetes sp. MPI-SDFR-AT-0126]